MLKHQCWQYPPSKFIDRVVEQRPGIALGTSSLREMGQTEAALKNFHTQLTEISGG
jgi:hypothetical protein